MRALVAGTVSLDLLAAAASSALARATAGSTGANVAVRLATKGWDVEMVGLIGDDEPGRSVRAELDAWGVDTTRLIAQPGVETPIVYQVVQPSGDPFLRRCPRCGRAQARHILPSPDQLVGACPRRTTSTPGLEVAVFDCGGTAERLLVAEVQARNALIWAELSDVSNADPVGPAVVHAAWALKCSSEDEHLLFAAEAARATPAPVTVVTLGKDGARVHQGGTGLSALLDAPVSTGAVVDPIGAGDAFTASCVDSLLRLPDPRRLQLTQLEEAVRAAQLDAANVLSVEGANGDLSRPPGAEPRVLPFACADCALALR